MRVLNWNLEWAKPGSPRADAISAIITSLDPDLICLTEAYAEILDHRNGHIVTAGRGNRVADRKGASKTLLWSRFALVEVSRCPGFSPPGRIVSAKLNEGRLKGLRVMAVCIPWRASGTPTVGGTSAPWEDHLAFIKHLSAQLARSDERTLVIGDFNQRLPRQRQPQVVLEALENALRHLRVATRGLFDPTDGPTIDHIAHSPDLIVSSLDIVPRVLDGLHLTDHFGVKADISAA